MALRCAAFWTRFAPEFRVFSSNAYYTFLFFGGATARGGPWPSLQYASRPLDPLLCLSIRLFPSFSGPWTRHPAISFLVFLFVYITHLDYLNNCLAINEFYVFKSVFPLSPPFYLFNYSFKENVYPKNTTDRPNSLLSRILSYDTFMASSKASSAHSAI